MFYNLSIVAVLQAPPSYLFFPWMLCLPKKVCKGAFVVNLHLQKLVYDEIQIVPKTDM